MSKPTSADNESPVFDRDIFREIWSAIQSPTPRTSTWRERIAQWAPQVILVIIAVFLALVIGLVSFFIYKRSEDGMADLLAEKGGSLLNVFEGALRTGMAGDSGLQLQTLLGEIAKGPDIEFVAVTMPDGTILAHSDPSRIGEMFQLRDEPVDSEAMEMLAPEDDEKWIITDRLDERVFLVYRKFTLGNKEWDKEVPEPIIFLGLAGSPFEITQGQNRSYVTILALVTMLVVLCGLLALSMAQRSVESRRRQRRAEGEVHRLEEEARRNEKMVAIGTLAAGVAHEIRNPLSSIKGYATYFRQRFPDGSDDRAAADVMAKEVDRLNRVITDLLGLSRPEGSQLRPVRIDIVMEHVVRLLRHNASSKHIQITMKLARNLEPVMGDMERLSQALLNLCLNAIDAMPDGGKLILSASGGKNRICLIIRDNGQGIAPDIINRIFDPYFTTKGSGTGLGLPMVHKIIKAHNGEIAVTSRCQIVSENGEIEERGWTMFRIWLPLASAAMSRQAGKGQISNK